MYVAPTMILPADLLEGAARNAVIIFARGVSAASLAASIAMACIKVSPESSIRSSGCQKLDCNKNEANLACCAQSSQVWLWRSRLAIFHLTWASAFASAFLGKVELRDYQLFILVS